MVNPKWNDDEVRAYRQLSKTDGIKDAKAIKTIQGLAYTAAQEMHNSRIAEEKLRKKEEYIRKALGMMAFGIANLEEVLGMDIHKIADKQFGEMLELASENDGLKKKIATLEGQLRR